MKFQDLENITEERVLVVVKALFSMEAGKEMESDKGGKSVFITELFWLNTEQLCAAYLRIKTLLHETCP